MSIEMLDSIKDEYDNVWYCDFSNNIDLYGDPNYDVERFIEGRNL